MFSNSKAGQWVFAKIDEESAEQYRSKNDPISASSRYKKAAREYDRAGSSEESRDAWLHYREQQSLIRPKQSSMGYFGSSSSYSSSSSSSSSTGMNTTSEYRRPGGGGGRNCCC